MTTSHTGVSPRLRVTKRVATLLLLPVTLLLSACHTEADVTVTAAGGVYATIELSADKSSADASDIDCNNYGLFFSSFPGTVTVERDSTNDLTTDVMCEISASTDNGMDGQLLIDNDSSYILNIPLSDFLASTNSDMQGTYHLAVHMPGDIISASGGGKIDGSNVVYEGDVSELNGDIKIEANKSSGTPFAVWVVGLLVVLLGGALGVSRYLRAKDSLQSTILSKFFGKKDAKDDKSDKKSKDSAGGSVDSDNSEGVSVATADSTVALKPLPEKYAPKNIDGISESYSEQIDMVDPIPQGIASDVVKRDSVVLVLPSETTEVSPIPGMPPRIPMPADVAQAEADEDVDGDEGAFESEPETAPKTDLEADPESGPENEASDFFSQFLEVTEDEDIDEETDL